MIVSKLPKFLGSSVVAILEYNRNFVYIIHPFNDIYSNGTYQENVIFGFIRNFS